MEKIAMANLVVAVLEARPELKGAKALAEKLGVSPSAVSKWVRGIRDGNLEQRTALRKLLPKEHPWHLNNPDAPDEVSEPIPVDEGDMHIPVAPPAAKRGPGRPRKNGAPPDLEEAQKRAEEVAKAAAKAFGKDTDETTTLAAAIAVADAHRMAVLLEVEAEEAEESFLRMFLESLARNVSVEANKLAENPTDLKSHRILRRHIEKAAEVLEKTG
jgi:transcriptional regulator with XRE-family HTH domain